MATTLPSPPQGIEATGGAPVQEQPLPPAPPSFGEKNRHLPEQLEQILTGIVKSFQEEELYDRRIEDLTDRAMRFYDDGVQHFYPNYATGVYQIGEAGGSVNVGNGEIECSEYMGAYNIFRARRRTIDSVLTQNPPGIDFQPDRPDRAEDQEASETAEGYWMLFQQKNDMMDIQQSITRYFELSGRVVAWTHDSVNQQKWGLNDQGEPRQMETAEIFGTLESTVPIFCRSQDDAIYCILYKDLHILKAKRENPWLKKDGVWEIAGGESGPAESEWKRYARLGVRQARKGAAVLNTTIRHLITETHCFLRPDAFECDACDPVYTGPTGWDEEAEQFITEPAVDEEGNPQTIRDFLNVIFPEGVHLKYLGECLSESTPESMDDAIDIVMSEKRDSMTGGALMEPMKIIQDGFNDFKNAERENYEKSWPMTHFKGDAQDYDAIVDQGSRPGQFNLIKNGAGGPDVPLANSFFKEPPMDVPESFQLCMNDYRGPLSQDITGASPALEGVAGPKEETASQRAMDKAQSTGILGPTWSRVQRTFAGIAKKAALLAASNPDHGKEITVATGDKQTVTIRLEKLTRGSFHCKPDQDSTFPDSTGAQRANLSTVLPQIAQTPIGMEMLNSPQNWEEILRIQGMTNFALAPAEAYRKQIREIDILLREAPEPNPAFEQYNQQHAALALQAMEAGLPEPPYQPPPDQLPSIQPDRHDFHKWEYLACQDYLSSEDANRQIISGGADGKGNEQGIQNVRLHADMHAQMGAVPAPFTALPMPMPAPKGTNPQAAQGTPQVQGASQPPGAPATPTV